MPLLRTCFVSGLTTVAVLALALSGAPAGAATVAPDLATAGTFAVLGGSTVTNTGPTTISGDLGVSPGTAVSGFGPGTVTAGTIHTADAVALAAQNDLTTAYNTAAGLPPTAQVTADLGGQRLVPGVYAGPTLSLTGALALDAGGDPDAVFVFQADSTLITASASSVLLLGGANPCNVYWQVGSSATLDTNSSFVGSILALTSVTANTGATVQGRLLARTGAVTLDSNSVTRPLCAAVVVPPTASPSATTTPAATTSPSATPTATTSPSATPTATTPAPPAPVPASPSPASTPPAPVPASPSPAPTTTPATPIPSSPAPITPPASPIPSPAPTSPAPTTSAAPAPPVTSPSAAPPAVSPPVTGSGVPPVNGPPLTPAVPTAPRVPTATPIVTTTLTTGSVNPPGLVEGALTGPNPQLPRTGAPLADLVRWAMLLMALGLGATFAAEWSRPAKHSAATVSRRLARESSSDAHRRTGLLPGLAS